MKKRSSTLFLILLLAAFLQFFQLGQRSLWEDEATVAAKSGWSFEVLLLYQKNAFFNLILSAWHRFGKGEFWLRIPSALFALFSLVALYEIGRKLFSEKMAVLAVFLLATSSLFLLESRQVKMYTLTLFLALLSFYFLLLFFETGRSGTLLAHVGVSLMAILTHYMFFFLLPLLLLWVLVRSGERPILLKRYLIGWLPLIFLFLPSLYAFVDQWVGLFVLHLHSKTPVPLVFPLGYLGKAALLFYLLTAGPTISPWNILWASLGCLLPLILFFRLLTRPKPWSLLWTLLALGFPLLFLPLSRNMQPRYVFIALPFYALLLSAGLLAFRPMARSLLFSGILLVQTYGLVNYFSGRQYLFIAYLEPYREVVDLVQKDFLPGDALLFSQHTPSLDYYFFDYFGKQWPRRRLHWIDTDGKLRLWKWEELKQRFPEGTKRLWFIERPPGQYLSAVPLPDPEAIHRETLAFRSLLDSRFMRVGQWRFLEDPDTGKKARFLKKLYLKERIVVSLYDLTASTEKF